MFNDWPPNSDNLEDLMTKMQKYFRNCTLNVGLDLAHRHKTPSCRSPVNVLLVKLIGTSRKKGRHKKNKEILDSARPPPPFQENSEKKTVFYASP